MEVDSIMPQTTPSGLFGTALPEKDSDVQFNDGIFAHSSDVSATRGTKGVFHRRFNLDSMENSFQMYLNRRVRRILGRVCGYSILLNLFFIVLDLLFFPLDELKDFVYARIVIRVVSVVPLGIFGIICLLRSWNDFFGTRFHLFGMFGMLMFGWGLTAMSVNVLGDWMQIPEEHTEADMSPVMMSAMIVLAVVALMVPWALDLFVTFGVLLIVGTFAFISRSNQPAADVAFQVGTFLCFLVVMSYARYEIDSGRREEFVRVTKTSSETRRKFLRFMFHEIRVPLSAVSAGVHLLQIDGRQLQAEHKAIVDDMAVAMETTASLLNNVLDLQRMEIGIFKLDLKPGLLHNPIEHAVSLSQFLGNSKHVRIRLIRCEGGENDVSHRPVMVDSTRLFQVFSNLLSNAIRHAPIGSDVIVRWSCTKDNKDPAVARFRAETTDFGLGVPAKDIPDLFKPRLTGNGLGLSICQGIVKAHNGRISLDRNVSPGATFVVEIPLDLTGMDAAETDFGAVRSFDWTQTAGEPSNKHAAGGFRHRFPSSASGLDMPIDGPMGGRREFDLPHSANVSVSNGDDGSVVEILHRQNSHTSNTTTNKPFAGTEGTDDGHTVPGDGSKPLVRMTSNQSLLGPSGSSNAASDTNSVASKSSFLSSVIVSPRSRPDVAVSNRCVLLVEDDKIVSKMTAQFVRKKFGYVVDVAADGVQAIEAVSRRRFAGRSDYIFILMDKNMPNMDGWECTRRLRDDGFKNPIFGLTGNTQHEDVQEFIAHGANAVLAKPLVPAKLAQLILQYVDDAPCSTTEPDNVLHRLITVCSTDGKAGRMQSSPKWTKHTHTLASIDGEEEVTMPAISLTAKMLTQEPSERVSAQRGDADTVEMTPSSDFTPRSPSEGSRLASPAWLAPPGPFQHEADSDAEFIAHDPLDIFTGRNPEPQR